LIGSYLACAPLLRPLEPTSEIYPIAAFSKTTHPLP
jgi:hypothetical protein